jgi:uncharacterized protein (UPF0333 family)
MLQTLAVLIVGIVVIYLFVKHKKKCKDLVYETINKYGLSFSDVTVYGCEYVG